jgi:HK97 family phage major capsid protein
MKLTSTHLKLALGLFIIAAGVFALAGHPLVDPAVLGSLSLVGFIGDTELKSLIEEQGRTWKQYQEANDALIKAKADGKAVSDLEAKVARIDDALTKFTEAKKAIEDALLKMQREALSDGDKKSKEDVAIECKSFNNMRRANAQAGVAVADLDVEAYKAYAGAFWTLVRKGSIDALADGERKALQAGVDSDGGYLMPAAAAGRVAKKRFDLSPIRQIANVQQISTEALEGLNDTDEASYGWAAEAGTRSETNTPTVGKYRIEAHEMYAAPKATQKLLDDGAVDVEAWLAAKVADKFARVEGAAFVAGTGIGQPRGFTSYTTAATSDLTRAWGTLEHVATGVAGDFAATSPADHLFALIGAFKPAYLDNAKWVTTRECITKVRKFKEATTNAYMWQPGLQAGQPDRLLGYPVVNAQDMPVLASGSLSMALGDFMEGYQIVDRIGIRTLRDPFTAKPYIIFYSTMRVGGGVLNYEAIKFIKFS